MHFRSFTQAPELKSDVFRWLIDLLAALALILIPQVLPRIQAAPLSDPPPTFTAVSPTEAYNFCPTTITITGTGFFVVTGSGLIIPQVTLNNVPLPTVTFVSSTTLTTTVPADLPSGVYTITVTNPDGQSSSLANAFTVLLNGDGSLKLWQPTTSMPEPRYRFAVVQTRGYVYTIGGRNDSANTFATVVLAPIGDDGSLGPWQTTTSMNTARFGHAAVTNGHYIYAIGGQITNSVERAAINLDGSLGPWEYVSAMNTPRFRLAAVVGGGYIYAIGGVNLDGTLATVERAFINADGSLGSWQIMPSMTTARDGHAAVVVANYIYAIAGSGQDVTLNSVERASINADGSLGPWQSVTPVSHSNCTPAAVAARGYIYVLGGYECLNLGPRYNDVERAKVNLDGSLSPWQPVFSMTTVRISFGAIQKDDHIYALGGEDVNSQDLSSVEHTEITDGLLPTGHGISINEGALFTNQVTVTLAIGAAPDTAQMQVSNDGGFTNAQWEPYTPHKVWQITQYGNYVIPRTVYVRYKNVYGSISATYQDDIILDVTAPTGSVSVITNTVGGNANNAIGEITVTLQLFATDDVSGVGFMQLSNDSALSGATWQTYTTRFVWPVAEASDMYVQYRDNAGNVSPTYSASLPGGTRKVYLPLIVR